MKLVEQLQAGPQHRLTPCQVRSIYDQLDEEDQKVLRSNIVEIQRTDPYSRSRKSQAKTIVWLADVLTKSGFYVGRSSLSRHINGQCSCESI